MMCPEGLQILRFSLQTNGSCPAQGSDFEVLKGLIGHVQGLHGLESMASSQPLMELARAFARATVMAFVRAFAMVVARAFMIP